MPRWGLVWFWGWKIIALSFTKRYSSPCCPSPCWWIVVWKERKLTEGRHNSLSRIKGTEFGGRMLPFHQKLLPGNEVRLVIPANWVSLGMCQTRGLLSLEGCCRQTQSLPPTFPSEQLAQERHNGANHSADNIMRQGSG